jgi:hypothetical protein
MNTIRNFCRGSLVRTLWIDPYPISRRPGKLNHLGSRITPHQVCLQLHRIRLPRKRPDLHAPPSTRVHVSSNRRGKRLNLYPRHPRTVDPCSLRRRQRKIDNSPPDKRPPVRNLYHDRLVCTQIRHPNHRPHWQGQVRCGHSVLVIHCAVGAFASGIRRPIPTRQPNLRRNRSPQPIRRGSRGGNRVRRLRFSWTHWLRALPGLLRTRIDRGRRWWRIGTRGLSVAPSCCQRQGRQRSRRNQPAPRHGFVVSFGGGEEAALLRAWSSIHAPNRCNSTAAARIASAPFCLTSGTTSSLIYLTTFFRSVSRCVATSRSCCSHGRFGTSVGIDAPLSFD